MIDIIPPFPILPRLFAYPPEAPQYEGRPMEDVVAVFDSSYTQMFPAARAMRAYVSPESEIMYHPIETGEQRADHIVRLPITLDLQVTCPGRRFREIYQQVKNAYISRDVFAVQTKVDTYFNMMLVGIPHDEDPEQMDTVIVYLRFSEVIEFSAIYQPLAAQQVANPNDQSTVDRGETPTDDASPETEGQVQLILSPDF